MPPPILLAHAHSAAPQAQAIAAQLKALGYDVTDLASRGPRTGGHKVVLLWSRQAVATPALRAVARKAQASGSLVCIRLDDAPPPVDTRSVRLPRGSAPARTWRRLLVASPRPKPAAPSGPIRAKIQTARAKRIARPAESVGTEMRHSESSSRTFAIALTFFLVSVAAVSVAYSRYPQVAAPIDSAAAAAYAQASRVAALAP